MSEIAPDPKAKGLHAQCTRQVTEFVNPKSYLIRAPHYESLLDPQKGGHLLKHLKMAYDKESLVESDHGRTGPRADAQS